MFGLFTPKEIALFRKGIDSLEHRIGTSSSFDEIRHVIDADIKRSAQPYIAAIRNSSSPEQVATTAVSNVAGNIVEGGSLCLSPRNPLSCRRRDVSDLQQLPRLPCRFWLSRCRQTEQKYCGYSPQYQRRWLTRRCSEPLAAAPPTFHRTQMQRVSP